MKIGILGAGVSGLSIARLLKDDFEVEVLEKESVVGGIARTKDVDGVAYHVNGGHCFASRYEDVKEFVFSSVLEKNKWNSYVKNAKILFKGHWIGNPIENSVLEIDKFDTELAFLITKEMLNASYEKGKNLEEWFINHFGPTLAREYFIPYNTKIWGIEPKNMDSVWTIDDKQMKLPIPTKENFYKSLVSGKGVDGMVEASGYYYPKTNNQNTFIEAIGNGVNIILNYPIKSIEKNAKKWVINGEREYDVIINTTPLDAIVDILKDIPYEIEKYFRNLKFNRISNVLCETDGSVDFTWAYIPDCDIGIHRTINMGTFFTPNRNYCLAESLGSHSIEYFEKEIKKLPFLKRIVGHNITDHAYVLFDLNYKDSKEKAIKYLDSLGIISHGRFGEWEYYNMDICIKRSIDLAKKIKEMKKSQTDDVKTRYTLASSTWDEKELQAIQEVIKSDIFTMGKKVAEFEKDFARFVGSKYAVMTSSGSTANLIATAALFYTKTPRLKRGDEVIVPAVSWSTTYYPLYQYGLKLKFVDIDLETLNYDLEALKTAITDSTKMIMCVNLLGNPNDFDAIKAMISNRDIILLEDNCESMGAEYKGKQAGTFGVMGTFSTFYSHHMATMEGGFVVTDDEELYHILLCLRAHGWTRNLPKDNLVAKKSDDWFSESFRFVLPGYNVRPVEMSGAIGIEQLKKLPSFLKYRRENAKLFCSYFANHPDFIIQKEIGSSSWFGFSLIIRPESKIQRSEIIQKLEKNKIEYRPIATGNFTQNEVIKYFDYTIHKELKNAKYLQEKGFFVGNHQVDISDSIKLFAEIIGRGGGANLVAFSSIKNFNATSIIFTISFIASIKNNISHLKLNLSQISCLQNLSYTTKAA